MSLPRLSRQHSVTSTGDMSRAASPRPEARTSTHHLQLEAGLNSIFSRSQTPDAGRSRAVFGKSRSRASLFEEEASAGSCDIEVYHTITGGNSIAASRQPLPFAKITRRPARVAARLEGGLEEVEGAWEGLVGGVGATHLSVPLTREHAGSGLAGPLMVLSTL